ncbi:MAG: YgiT-type zinc finger protein [Inquilinus sp.]|nr:YgiT-type zinc finger protein [Inquilinus sp.]
MESHEQEAAVCSNCGSPKLEWARVRSAFWHQDTLVVVEDIPALVCDKCQERHYDDQTVVALDLMRGEGFPAEGATGELRVPVFAFGHRARPKVES